MGEEHSRRCSRSKVRRHSLAEAYHELGLEVGADMSDVKRAFRKLAREFHPDVCDPAHLLAAGERFAEILNAYETITSGGNFAGTGAAANPDFGHRMGGFSRNMASGTGHHKVSDGRLFELWLDVRGDPQLFDNARQEVVSLFFRMRSTLDEMGISLAKEGAIAAILADIGPDGKPPSEVANWDHKWMPLMLVDNTTGIVTHALSGEQAGRLRPMNRGRLLAASPKDPLQTAADSNSAADPAFLSEDLFISASDAAEARRAKRRYVFAMQALVLPPDAASWVVAGAVGDVDDEEVTAVGRRFSSMT